MVYYQKCKCIRLLHKESPVKFPPTDMRAPRIRWFNNIRYLLQLSVQPITSKLLPSFTLCTWLGGATPQRIQKYISGYRALYPTSAILLITTHIFSHGGCNTAIQLALSLQTATNFQIGNHLKGIIFDCCPGETSFAVSSTPSSQRADEFHASPVRATERPRRLRDDSCMAVLVFDG